jgi:dCMP deaminase
MKNFMELARKVAENSKDPSTQVGAVIVDEQNRIVSTGYNGFVAGCYEDEMSWERPMKYHLVIHAEMNALLFARRDLKGCTLYVTHAPCDTCLKHVLQAQVKVILYDSPGPMRERGTYDQKEAIGRLIRSTFAIVKNYNNGKKYWEELFV